jgi:hypothetical protein
MRTLRSIGVWMGTGGLMLALGSAGWSQQDSQQQGSRQSNGPGLGQTGGSGVGQTGNQSGHSIGSSTPSSSSPMSTTLGPADTPLNPLEQDQAKMRNLDRQKKLVDDTAKLLSLANELKTDVDKSSKDTLSLDVIKKADEIEKLARSVKEKMKGS